MQIHLKKVSSCCVKSTIIETRHDIYMYIPAYNISHWLHSGYSQPWTILQMKLPCSFILCEVCVPTFLVNWHYSGSFLKQFIWKCHKKACIRSKIKKLCASPSENAMIWINFLIHISQRAIPFFFSFHMNFAPINSL